MNNRRCFIDYVKDVASKLQDANYDSNKILDIVNRLNSFNKIDYHFPRKGWKYLIENFAPEIKRNENVYFTKINETRSAMCLKIYNSPASEKDQGSYKYIVTFAFKHPKDEYDPDYKKYLVYKYIKGRDTSNYSKYHTYIIDKASSYKNAIVLANNKHLSNDVKCEKLQLLLMFSQNIVVPTLESKPDVQPDFYFKNCYENYKRIREDLINKYDLKDKDIRFYYGPNLGILVVRNNSSYHVTFSFINPKDRYFLDNLNNIGDAKHIYRYCLIKNFLVGTYSYKIDNADNSMDAAVKMFNRHRFDFPSYYHDNKLDILIKSEKDTIC